MASDATDKLAQNHKVLVKTIEGKWLTTGDPLNYFKASIEYALNSEDLKDDVIKYLKNILSV